MPPRSAQSPVGGPWLGGWAPRTRFCVRPNAGGAILPRIERHAAWTAAHVLMPSVAEELP